MNHSNPRKVEFVKKPILSVMGLLALLGDEQIKTSITFENGDHDDFGVMATVIEAHRLSSTNDWELAALLYNSNDTSGRTSLSLVNISVVNLPSRQDVAFVVYRLDNDNGNPFGLWKEMGSPVFPSDDQFSELRLHQVIAIESFFLPRLYSIVTSKVKHKVFTVDVLVPGGFAYFKLDHGLEFVEDSFSSLQVCVYTW